MDLQVQGTGPSAPLLSARDLFETERDLQLPVYVRLREDPDVRTWAAHYEDHHVLNISKQAANSVMARELALHEFAHMARYEEAHPSHTQSMAEVLYLALSGRQVERHRLAHCYQIANHMKDIYADDITLTVGPGQKLLAFLESSLAASLRDRPGQPPSVTAAEHVPQGSDPSITAVNAAFALALGERHDLLEADHQLYDLARTAAADAPGIDFDTFCSQFRELAHDPDPSSYRQQLVDTTRSYVVATARAAD